MYFSSILVACLFTAVSALPHANNSSSLDHVLEARQLPGQMSICGANDAIEAKCAMNFANTNNDVLGQTYYHSKAVLRISRNGGMLCTGWLVGDQGHIITAFHCLKDAEAETFTFEAMAEGPTCTSKCNIGMACPGRKIHTTPVKFNSTGGNLQNDWTILQLSEKDNQDARKLGIPFLKIRKSGAIVDERIYTAGHPNGHGKRIGLLGPGGFAKILSIKPKPAGNANTVTYNVDTNGGASGSPVLSFRDNAVVALVTIGGCATKGVNEGVNGEALFQAMKTILPASAWID
jgi:V8-like Glu-specific endopeptidase